MKQPQATLRRTGWTVIIKGTKGDFITRGRAFFATREEALVVAKENRAHNLQAVTRRVKLETL